MGKGCNIKEENVFGLITPLSREDPSLHCCSICYGFVRIYTLIGLLAIEILLEEILNLRDAGGPSDQNKLVNFSFFEAGILHCLFHRTKGLSKQINVQLLESGTSEGFREVNSIIQALDFNTNLVLV
mmetsp:Transcript_2990/g.3998  ORF Transcript_2990/g.3998 Transcript_2990/m.3998 type:complete len:127 (-) Transcript_2990:1029-1409(-)